jgi:hypothetical protein
MKLTNLEDSRQRFKNKPNNSIHIKFHFPFREKSQIDSMQEAFTQQINSLIQDKVFNEVSI